MAKTKTSKTGKGKVESLRSQTSGKETALQRVIAQIEKQYGQGAIMQMDEHNYAKIKGVPTGSLSLDMALGGAGVP
jgi:recombination protein RecA